MYNFRIKVGNVQKVYYITYVGFQKKQPSNIYVKFGCSWIIRE